MSLKIAKNTGNSPKPQGASNKAPFTLEFVKDRISLAGAKVKRGRLTNARTGTFLEFLYNPTEVSESMGVNMSEDNLPGASDPLIHFASGKVRQISFKLDLCGESSLRFRGVNLINAAKNDVKPPDGTYSIAGEIEFFQSFTFPVNPKFPGADGGNDKAVFTLGRLWDGVLVAVVDVNLKVTEFTPDLEPSRATIDLTLKRVVTETVFADRHFTQSYEGFIP